MGRQKKMTVLRRCWVGRLDFRAMNVRPATSERHGKAEANASQGRVGIEEKKTREEISVRPSVRRGKQIGRSGKKTFCPGRGGKETSRGGGGGGAGAGREGTWDRCVSVISRAKDDKGGGVFGFESVKVKGRKSENARETRCGAVRCLLVGR